MPTTNTQKAYGQITIIDITDVGTLSVVPESNLPTTVVYNPNQESYSPDWGAKDEKGQLIKPLVLTPMAVYAGTALSTAELAKGTTTVKWYEVTAIGENLITDSTSGHAIDPNSKQLTIGTRRLSAATGGLSVISYRCEIIWKEPQTETDLKASGLITFSLQMSGERLHTVRIQAPAVVRWIPTSLKYASDLELKAIPTNTRISKWQWFNSKSTQEDKWETISTGINCTISADDLKTNYFLEGQVNERFKVVAVWEEDATKTVEDEIIIFEISDGEAGTQIVTFTLSNTNQTIPCKKDQQGNYTDYNFDLAYTSCDLLEGGESIFNKGYYKVTAQPEDVLGTIVSSSSTWSSNSVEITSVDTKYYVRSFSPGKTQGRVTFTAAPTATGKLAGYTDPITQTFTVSALLVGQDGQSAEFYSIESNFGNTIKRTVSQSEKDTSISYSPTTGTFTFYKQVGATTNKEHCDWYLYSVKSSDGSIDMNAQLAYAGNTQEWTLPWGMIPLLTTAQTQITVVAKPIESTQILATFPITFIQDGDKGDPGLKGDNGTNGLNFIFSNPTDQISCYANGEVVEKQTMYLPFSVYDGAKALDTGSYRLISSSQNLPTGMTVPSGNQLDDNFNSIIIPNGTQLEITVADNSSLEGLNNGSISFTVQKNENNSWKNEDNSPVFVFTWVKNCQGQPGQSSILLVLSTPDGGIMHNGEGSERIKAELYVGGDIQKTTNWSVQWSKYIINSNTGVGSYTTITDTTIQSAEEYAYILTVNKSLVDSLASFECKATYTDTNPATKLTQYQTILDYNDPLQVSVHCSMGTQLINGQGVGAIYTRVFRNGVEVDPLKSSSFVETTPTGNSYYYLLDTTAKTATLKNSKGEDVTPDPYEYFYTYTFKNADGSVNNSIKQKTGKVIYIDGTQINSRIVVDVEVYKK